MIFLCSNGFKVSYTNNSCFSLVTKTRSKICAREVTFIIVSFFIKTPWAIDLIAIIIIRLIVLRKRDPTGGRTYIR